MMTGRMNSPALWALGAALAGMAWLWPRLRTPARVTIKPQPKRDKKRRSELVDEMSEESFPASDPPSY